ncbi:MAG: hypoxanthine phosphoribosyltransferase [Planctomycetes bacterium]|nr:hypoxanthine phosphoribosyltransferase [Planctomycetota bacterium]
MGPAAGSEEAVRAGQERVSVLISADSIAQKVGELGELIARDHPGKPIHLLGVLKGSFIFMADLARAIPASVSCDFLRVASYQGSKSTGEVRFDMDLTEVITGKVVILVEDIIDTGATMDALLRILRARGPASLSVCSLLHKPDRTKVRVPIDYLGFTIPNKFVVGYGLDYDGRHRNLPYIGVVEGLAE